jgi:hypothetical protein
MKIVGFLSNKLTLRGTEVAMYDYADFNETILGNRSIAITRPYEVVQHELDAHPEAYKRFADRFPLEFYRTQADIDAIVMKHGITHLYVTKYGVNDGLLSTKCRNLVHAVFDSSYPHGEVYAAISDHINELKRTLVPVVPYMVRVGKTPGNYRSAFDIPDDAIVFGRHGGFDSFDLPFVHATVQRVLQDCPHVWFLFMNTQQFCQHPRALFMQGSTDLEVKRAFINSCDAHLHARGGGETFGLTCGEFAVCLKPVITFANSPETNHIGVLGEKAVLYRDADELYRILSTFAKDQYDMQGNGYLAYTPEKVMAIFDRVYLRDDGTPQQQWLRERDARRRKEPHFVERLWVPAKVFVNGFWGGFLTGDDANDVTAFQRLLSKTVLGPVEFTQNASEADVLLESVFGPSLLRAKKHLGPHGDWKCTIYYSGEPFAPPVHANEYTLVLDSEPTAGNNVNFPLYLSYLECNGFLPRLLARPQVTRVPPKFCCFIVSNGNSPTRLRMFDKVQQYKRVDSMGAFANNMPGGQPLQAKYHTAAYFEVLSQYKFILCFENTKKGTYITEKLINPYLAGIVPVYWGTNYVHEVFNAESMVYLEDETDEASFNRVLAQMVELDQDDAKYLEMVNRPVFSTSTKARRLDLDTVAADINRALLR